MVSMRGNGDKHSARAREYQRTLSAWLRRGRVAAVQEDGAVFAAGRAAQPVVSRSAPSRCAIPESRCPASSPRPARMRVGLHYDATEIFTLQLAGHKRWRFFHQRRSRDPRTLRPRTLGSSTREFVLEPETFFIVPRGIVHEVMADDALSVSIPIIVQPVAWKELLFAAGRASARPAGIPGRGCPPAGSAAAGRSRNNSPMGWRHAWRRSCARRAAMAATTSPRSPEPVCSPNWVRQRAPISGLAGGERDRTSHVAANPPGDAPRRAAASGRARSS